jgi:hypothetical protein
MIILLLRAPASRADAKFDFLSRYEPAVKTLEEFYRHIRIVGQSTKTNFPALNGTQIEKLVFEANGPRLRMESTVIESHQESLPAGLIRVVVANPGSSFYAKKAPQASAFVLKNLTPNSAESDRRIRWVNSLAAAPYQYRDQTILEFFRMPDVGVASLEETETDGERATTVSYELPGTAPGSFVFLPDKAWALREYTIGTGSVRDRKVIEYAGAIDGIPLLKRIKAWRDEPDGKWLQEIIEIEEIEPGDVPEDEFALASVGIADVGPEVSRGYGLLLLILGGVTLAGATLLLALLRRARR